MKAQLDIFKEEFAWSNSSTYGYNIYLNEKHVGHRVGWWEAGIVDSFSTLYSLSEPEFRELKGMAHWICAHENEDGGLTPECDSFQRFSVLLDILNGEIILNANLV